LQDVLQKVVETFDCTVLCGHRGKEDQEARFVAGNSKARWPNSKHNSTPSRAVDVLPYPINWADRERMTFFAGYVLATALSLGVKLRWGGDWNQDTQTKDNAFDDLGHFELID
jgi:hypothetical protein